MPKVLTGDLLGSVDECLEHDADLVFVPPQYVDGSVVAHVEHRGTLLGVYGADTRDGHDDVRAWANRIDVVYADHPATYR